MEFTIEEICASRVREGEVEYHIKWSGYDESENTWEVSYICFNMVILLLLSSVLFFFK
jgi:hypothetical protein